VSCSCCYVLTLPSLVQTTYQTCENIHNVTRNENRLKLEMRANAQRDGHPTKYRWRPLSNAAKFGWCPVLECRAVETRKVIVFWAFQDILTFLDRRECTAFQDIFVFEGDFKTFLDCRLPSLFFGSRQSLHSKVLTWHIEFRVQHTIIFFCSEEACTKLIH